MAFVLYALTLTVATHWPALDLGTESYSAPDKVLHMIALGGLVVLLQRTRWLTATWQAVLVGLVWAAVDELTQAIPILGRHASAGDMLAGQLGILLVGSWWWALGPAGSPADRDRHRRRVAAMDEVFASLHSWIIVGLVALLGAAIAVAVAWPVLAGLGVGTERLTWVVVAGIAGAGSTGLFAAARRAGLPPVEARRLRWRGVRRAAPAAIAVLAAAALLTSLPPVRRGLGTDMRLAFGVTALGLAAAVAVGVYRRTPTET